MDALMQVELAEELVDIPEMCKCQGCRRKGNCNQDRHSCDGPYAQFSNPSADGAIAVELQVPVCMGLFGNLPAEMARECPDDPSSGPCTGRGQCDVCPRSRH